jgi:hypothetical protein
MKNNEKYKEKEKFIDMIKNVFFMLIASKIIFQSTGNKKIFQFIPLD